MTEFRDWSITASANTGSAVDGYFMENMQYSEVNDAAREFQAILARDRSDKNGSLLAGGSSSSYVLSISANIGSYRDGDYFRFRAPSKNTGATTLQISSLSARPVVKTDLSALAEGDIIAGGIYEAYYRSDSANFQLLNPSITAEGLGSSLYPTELWETTAGILPVQKRYPPGHAWRYMTTAEVTAALAYTFVTSHQTALQNALDVSFAGNVDLDIPAGGYLVTGLTMPGTISPDTRAKAFSVRGQGCGVPYSLLNTGGTILKSATDAPILQDNLVSHPNGVGEFHISGIRFDGTSDTYAVVLLNNIYGLTTFERNVIYQRGNGDGMKIQYAATVLIQESYAFNADLYTYTLGAARTGVGFNYINTHGSGLVSFKKLSSRGFKTGYKIQGDASDGTAYAPRLEDSECSVVYNGVDLVYTVNAVIDHCYFEAGDQGTGIIDAGAATSITNNFISSGFATSIDASDTTGGYGTRIEGNLINMAATENAIGIDIASTGATGGNAKNITNNTIIYTAGTAGVKGIKITGTDPRINISGTAFVPRAAWTGSGTVKISDESTNGPFGFSTVTNGDADIPMLARGAISLYTPATALTSAAVSGGVLTLPEGSSFVITSGSTVTVNSIDGGTTRNRLVYLRTTTADMTFDDGAFMLLDGDANFTGPGILTLMLDYLGGSHYAYEIGRTML